MTAINAALANATDPATNMPLSNEVVAGLLAGTEITPATAITLSQDATGGGSQSLTFGGNTVMNGTLTSNAQSVTGLSNASELFVGETVTGTGIPANTTVSAITPNNYQQIALNATSSSILSLQLFATATDPAVTRLGFQNGEDAHAHGTGVFLQNVSFTGK